MKATGEPGWHFIDLYPGIYKGSETRPNNFRIPQLTMLPTIRARICRHSLCLRGNERIGSRAVAH